MPEGSGAPGTKKRELPLPTKKLRSSVPSNRVSAAGTEFLAANGPNESRAISVSACAVRICPLLRSLKALLPPIPAAGAEKQPSARLTSSRYQRGLVAVRRARSSCLSVVPVLKNVHQPLSRNGVPASSCTLV